MDRKPDITDEEIGIQHFHLRKRRATERALEKVRHGLGKAYTKLSTKDIEILEWILGETWSMMGFYEWERIPFSLLSFEDIEKIINIGKGIFSHQKKGVDGIEEVHQLLTKAREEVEE
jgi:hypothetical protein